MIILSRKRISLHENGLSLVLEEKHRTEKKYLFKMSIIQRKMNLQAYNLMGSPLRRGSEDRL